MGEQSCHERVVCVGREKTNAKAVVALVDVEERFWEEISPALVEDVSELTITGEMDKVFFWRDEK